MLSLLEMSRGKKQLRPKRNNVAMIGTLNTSENKWIQCDPIVMATSNTSVSKIKDNYVVSSGMPNGPHVKSIAMWMQPKKEHLS